MAGIKYQKIDEDSYEASDGTNTVVVNKISGLYRSGGAQWEVRDVPVGNTHVKQPTLALAAMDALQRLSDPCHPRTKPSPSKPPAGTGFWSTVSAAGEN
jgi:hypothetical protein